MFESICIHLRNSAGNQDLTKQVDFGLLAEAMLYYQRVFVIADGPFLEVLIRRFQADVLLEYLESGHLEILFLNNNTGIYTENSGSSRERHRPIVWSMPDFVWEARKKIIFESATGLSRKGAARLARRASRHIKTIVYDEAVEQQAAQDFADRSFVKYSVRGFLSIVTPEYRIPNDFFFNVHKDGEQLAVETNLDFKVANEIYHSRYSPEHSTLSPAYILSNLMSARGEQNFACKLNSEMAFNELERQLFKLQFDEMIRTRMKSGRQIEFFQDYVFHDAHAVADAIRNRQRTFGDLQKVLDKSKRFKEWLSAKDTNDDLLRDYVSAVTEKSWIEKLPPKSVRWVIFQAIGLAADELAGGGLGKILAAAVGAGDTFLFDGIAKGWKPNQFIERVNDFVPSVRLS